MTTRYLLGILLGAALAAAVSVAGCKATILQPNPEQIPSIGRAELLQRTCSRCHHLRSPSTFNDMEWDMIIRHMHAHANIRVDHANIILEFLKAAN